jgi:integrase
MMNLQTTAANDTALTTERAERIREYVDAGRTNATQRAYGAAWRHFTAFCAQNGYSALPASPEVVCDYLAHSAATGASVSLIEQRRAAIRFAHRGQVNPCADDRVTETMRGIRRKVGTAVTPKAPMLPNDLARLTTALPNDLRGLRDRALLLMGEAGAFRRSELVALTVNDVNIRRDDDGDVMSIRIAKSKTDQEGKGKYKTIPALSNTALCALTAYRVWMDAAKINSGPVFRSIDRWGHIDECCDPMDGKEVARIVKAACKGAGVDPRRFAGHSLRSGFVTAAKLKGVGDADIMEMTGHESAMTLKRYTHMAGLGAKRAARAVFGA